MPNVRDGRQLVSRLPELSAEPEFAVPMAQYTILYVKEIEQEAIRVYSPAQPREAQERNPGSRVKP